MFFSFNENVKHFGEKFSKDPDLVVRVISVCGKKVGLVYLKSMIDKQMLTQSIYNSILEIEDKKLVSIKNFNDKVLCAVESEIVHTIQDAEKQVLKNCVVIFIEKQKQYVSVDAGQVPSRQPTEPPTSSVIKGPREGFTESIKSNIAMIRKRLVSDKFVYENIFVGKYSNTQVSVCYLLGVADRRIVKKIKNRIKEIDIDGIVDSHYLVSFLEERKFSMFKQVGTAEKPDIIAAKMLEGRVAILVDNSPIVLTLPFIYIEEAQNSNDYYGRTQYATFIRWIRIAGIFISVIVPGAYLALRLYHYKIIPLKFLVTISNSTQGLPFTPFVELLFILILFEILYEVSLRLPRYLGLATSIVGALILGDTGVKAGLISPPGVMIIAMSVISIYTIPDEWIQLSLSRAIFLLLGGMLGIFGIVGGIVYFTNYLNGLNGYGAPYLSPISPYIKSDMKDALHKVSLIQMNTRPKSFSIENRVRQKHGK